MGICGKSDFQDLCEMHYTPAEIIEKYKIYAAGNDIVPLKMESEKDLVAYYTYLISSMFGSKDGGHIHLMGKSFIDLEEEEQLTLEMDAVKKYYRSCKRNKKPFDRDEALRRIVFPIDCKPKKHEEEIVDRVAKLGEKATIEDIHDPWHDRMRGEWYKLMIDRGWDENEAYKWVYGFRRFIDMIKRKEHEAE